MKTTTTTSTAAITPVASPILAYLQGFFEDKLMVDNREPWIEFDLPGTTDRYGLYAPGGELWKQIIVVRVATIPPNTHSCIVPPARILVVT
jgi:hypothetical protein